jgi:pyruvate kinase
MDIPRTKLVCTIGPASVNRVRELIDAGMSVARINFSHGTAEEHKAAVHAVRAAAHHARSSVAVMADLPGAKVRLGDLPDGEIELEVGGRLILRPVGVKGPSETDGSPKPTAETDAPLEAAADAGAEPTTEVPVEPTTDAPAEPTTDAPAETGSVPETQAAPVADASSTAAPSSEAAPESPSAINAPGAADASEVLEVPVGRASLADELQVGDRILLADGAAELRVTELGKGVIQTEIVRGGRVRSRSGVNIPAERLVGPVLTPADEEGLRRALELRVDMVAQSFIRSADDVTALRRRLPADGPLLVAKIETRAAVDAFDGIAEVSDGLMIARGDLGVDIPYEEVPLIQKDLLRRGRAVGRFTIVATQMLESMAGAPRPTRAEASDVANAVLDGADAVMLSAETAIGRFPLEAAQAMISICRLTERNGPAAPTPAATIVPDDGSSAVVHGAAAMSTSYPRISAAWCFTRTGRTAELLSQLRPRVPVLAFTVSAVTARRLAGRWGVVPMVIPGGRTGQPLIERMEAAARARRMVEAPATVLLLTTSQQPGGVNRVELHEIE